MYTGITYKAVSSHRHEKLVLPPNIVCHSTNQNFTGLLLELERQRVNYPRTIIYRQTMKDCANAYSFKLIWDKTLQSLLEHLNKVQTS